MKKRIASIISCALLAAMCLGVTAYAMTPAPDTLFNEPPMPDDCYINEPPLPATPESCPVQAGVSVVGKSGSRYEPGDLIVLTASIENRSTELLSGQLWLTYPEGIGTVVAEPVLAFERWSENGCWCSVVEDLEPGMGAELVVVLRAPQECDTADWAATAEFLIKDGGGACAVVAEGHFGKPVLKADKSGLLKDGVLRIRNTGNGGASRVKFRFLAKKGWQTQEGLSDGMAYIGEGRIEVDLGGISVNGKIEKDLSGILHQRMDPDGEFEIVYETDPDAPMEWAQWEEAPVE